MPKINVTYVLCKIGGISQYSWIADAIDKKLIELSFIFLDETTNTLKEILTEKGISCYQLSVNSKKDIPKAVYQTIKIFKKEKTDVVHTHLVDASLVGLTAAKFMGIKKRIHTRHHADFHHQHYKKGVLLDNLINFLSTDIIVISKNVQEIVQKKEKYHSQKIHLIYHGFKLDDFEQVPQEKINLVKSAYSIYGHPVIGMISRYETGKGIPFAILAFEKIRKEFPEAQLVIANAFGADTEKVKALLSKLPENSTIEIVYEKEIKALYKCFDIMIHVPEAANYEAFGQVYIEAMAAGVPGIFTLSGIANEYIINHKNAIVVAYKNDEEIYTAIKKYMTDIEYKKNIIYEAKRNVTELFGIRKMMSELNALYLA